MPQLSAGVATSVIPQDRIAASIYVIRGQKVMFDSDLAALYGIETRVLMQSVNRNLDRFPDDFMLKLTKEEADNLKSQIVTSSWGGSRKPPYAFTEHGVAMLSSVLRSKRATEINIGIIRAFVKLRTMLATNEELARTVSKHDRQITILFDEVQKLVAPPPTKKPRIGFIAQGSNSTSL